MQRRRQSGWRHGSTPSAGVRKDQPVVVSDFAGNADTFVKILEIGAATKSYVLAVIDLLAAGKDVRCGAPAQSRSFFNQVDTEAALTERHRSGQPRETAANDDYVGRAHVPGLHRPAPARSMIHAFWALERPG